MDSPSPDRRDGDRPGSSCGRPDAPRAPAAHPRDHLHSGRRTPRRVQDAERDQAAIVPVGDEIPTREAAITQAGIRAYAEASRDRNLIQLDAIYARTAGLPGIIAHGMLQMGILTEAVTDLAGVPSRHRKLHCRFAAVRIDRGTS